MAYTINQGYQDNGLDKVQSGLLVGLPVIALILVLGAIIHTHSANNQAGINAKLIPIVSSLSNTKDGTGNDQSNNSSTTNNGSSTTASNTASSQSTSPSALGTGSGATSASGSSTIVGGVGGGPTGSASSSSSGILPINASLYIPPTDVQAGGKSVMNTSGTTVNLN